MADTPEDDELLLDQQAEGDEPEQQEEQEQGSEKAGDEADDELEVTFGDEAAPASGERDTGLVKHLRDEIRRRDTELAEIRRTGSAPQRVEVGEYPTLESVDYDEDKHREAVEAWTQRKAAADRQQTASQEQDRAVAEAWQADVRRFEARKAELRVPDAEEAIETARAGLKDFQQAVIVKVADNPALVFAALGKHPGKLAEIASIQDPLKQAAAVVKLEGTLKVAPRRKAPEPEQIERGNASVTHGKDATLERLEKQAAKTGDRTALIAHKKQLEARTKK